MTSPGGRVILPVVVGTIAPRVFLMLRIGNPPGGFRQPKQAFLKKAGARIAGGRAKAQIHDGNENTTSHQP